MPHREMHSDSNVSSPSHSNGATATFLPRDSQAFFRELEDLTRRVYADRRPGDVSHLKRIERWGRVSTFLGYLTAWLGFNPFSALAIALGISTRWAVAHHVLHRGYDAYPEAKGGYHSKTFGRGVKRWLHWCDWLPVEAWVLEHNHRHHYRLGEAHDPDVPEMNFVWLEKMGVPTFVKYFAVGLAALTWKWSYYAPRIVQLSTFGPKEAPEPYSPFRAAAWSLFHAEGRRVWVQSWLPHAALRFGLIPALFLPLGHHAWMAVLLNTLAAELITNIHAFCVVVPNHAGEEIPRFEQPPQNKNEFRLRQIVGSVNFTTGGDRNDFLHGWLNYQIEHHVWPDISMRQYQTWQPHLRELCRKYGVPYLQQSVGRRVAALVHNVTGKAKMPVLASLMPELAHP